MSFISCLLRLRVVCAAASALPALALTTPSASAAYVTVYGGPTYTPDVGGFKGLVRVGGVNNGGVAVGDADKFDGSDMHKGSAAFRWDGSAPPRSNWKTWARTPVASRAPSPSPSTTPAQSSAGANKYDDFGEELGSSAVRWDSSGVATELGSLGMDPNGFTGGTAYAINAAGTAVGLAAKYDDAGVNIGGRAVRWDASGTAATALDSLGDAGPITGGRALAINAGGTAVGEYLKSGMASGFGFVGEFAVRWDGSSSAATELGILDADKLQFFPDCVAVDLNDAGTAVGHAYKFDESGFVDLGTRAVRWDASGTAATELGNLGTDPTGDTDSEAYDINAAGTAVGQAIKYDDFGSDLGNRAVRWDTSGTDAIELGNLGTDPDGFTNTAAYAVNDAGVAVGVASKYDGSGTCSAGASFTGDSTA